MTTIFLAPLWLLGLLPWGVLTIWLLLGRRTKVGVPFLPLWEGSIVANRTRQAVRLPPLALAAMIAAMLLAILAASKPTVSLRTEATPVVPANPVHNAVITSIAAREKPSAELMVTIRNESAQADAELHVLSAGLDVARRIDLPPTGKEANYFVQLPKFGDAIEARLNAANETEPGHIARLARESRPPRLELRSQVSDPLARIVEIYAHVKPPRDGSPVVVLVNRPGDLPSGQAGVVVETPTAGLMTSGSLNVVDHSLTAVVDWQHGVSKARVASTAPEGWKPLVKVGERVLVAARELPSRQVWVGFENDAWPRSADFVVFWTNAFDWLGGGGREFAPELMTKAPVIPPQIPVKPISTRRDISPWFILVSLGAIFVAALRWKASRVLL